LALVPNYENTQVLLEFYTPAAAPLFMFISGVTKYSEFSELIMQVIVAEIMLLPLHIIYYCTIDFLFQNTDVIMLYIYLLVILLIKLYTALLGN